MSEEFKRPRGRPRKIEIPPLRPVTRALHLSKRAEKEIRLLASESKIAPEQVLEDVVDQGILQARAMYEDLIECRKRLQERKNAPPKPEEPGHLEPPADGRPEEQSDNGVERLHGSDGPVTEFDQGLRPGLDDVAVLPGQSPGYDPNPENAGETFNLVGGGEDQPFGPV